MVLIFFLFNFFFVCVCGDLVGEWWLCSSPPSYLLGEERVGGEDLEFVVCSFYSSSGSRNSGIHYKPCP